MKRSPSPDLRRSKRLKRAPARTPQTVAEQLAELPTWARRTPRSPEELAAAETAKLAAKLQMAQRRMARESQGRRVERDAAFYLSDPFSYKMRNSEGLVTVVDVARDEMFVFKVRTVRIGLHAHTHERSDPIRLRTYSFAYPALLL